MSTGEMIRIKSRDGFEFDAYHVKAQGPRKAGFIVQPPDVAANMARSVDLAKANGQDNAMNDIGGVFDVLSKSGKVCITGYCYGGSMSWLAGSRTPGIAAASSYF